MPFPTDDLQVENLYQIKVFCYLPFNPDTVMQSFDKYYQYSVCEKIGIPYPKTCRLNKVADLEKVEDLIFPVLVKPSTRVDIVQNVFRNIYLEDSEKYLAEKTKLKEFIEQGVEFIASEFVPGDDTNIYAYTCYRSQNGIIQNEWTGKKLTQYPDNYGVFCSASNEAPDMVLEQGRLLVDALDAYGVVEPEFKFDERDGKFKLMEVNLRSMMWHRTGKISGVRLHKSMYDFALGSKPIKDAQYKEPTIHFVYMVHEVGNLIARKGYWKYFKHNVWGGDKRVWAVYELQDIKPFLYGLYLLSKASVSACLKRFGMR